MYFETVLKKEWDRNQNKSGEILSTKDPRRTVRTERMSKNE